MTSADAQLSPVECWRLDGGRRTAVLASFAGGVPSLIWFGASLPPGEDLAALTRATVPAIAGGQLDPLVPLTLCPTPITGWQGHPGLVVTEAGGDVVLPDLGLTRTTRNGPLSYGFDVADRNAAGAVSLTFEVALDAATGLLSVQSRVRTTDGYRTRWNAAGAIPVPANLDRILDHGGRWCGEFRRQQTRFQTGQVVRDNREGRTGHAGFPGVVFLSDATSETAGPALAATLSWSGGARMIAEELPDGRRQLQFGIADEGLGAAEAVAPAMILGWSDDGLSGVLQAMQAHVRALHPEPTPRPVHYNCWEAVYFRHEIGELKEIARIAASLGAERFVLDDGWFKGRNNDTSSLGDWVVDRNKFPDGLQPLIDHVTGLGMSFGLWFEPEMVNHDSDLFRAHPDWVLGPRGQPSGRHQHVLDLSRPGVADYLFIQIDAVLGAYPIDYVKWDHNRILTGGGARQTVALYGLLDRLRAAHPRVTFESCASGGGRIDYGILARAGRVWLSDSNDALERLRIQHEAARWLPPEFTGSHVGPRTCHTSGRVLPMAFRAWVAAQRHMGFEMDPRELTTAEAATLRRVTAWWKVNRDFLATSRQFLLETHDPEVVAEIHVDSAADRFVLFKGQAGASSAIAARRFGLAGLDAGALYEARLVNPEDVAPALNRASASGFARGEPIVLSGGALMGAGLPLPNAFPVTMYVVEGHRLKRQD